MASFNNMTTLNFIQFVSLYYRKFVDNLSDFTNLFSDLNNTYAISIQNIIEEIKNINIKINPPATSNSQVMEKLELISEGRKNIQILFNYAMIAFDNKQEVAQFGKSDYQKAILRDDDFADLLIFAHDAASEPTNNAILTAAGLSQSLIDSLLTIAEGIKTKQAEIFKARAEQKKLVELRNNKINELKKKLRKINKASKVVFREQPAKLQQFYLYPKVQHKKRKPKETDKKA